MTPSHDDWSPDAKQLAAFVDGELLDDPGLRLRIRAWLAIHPDAETPARLTDLFRATRPADPGPAAWATMRERIAAGTGTKSKVPWHPMRWGLALAACAAGVWLAVSLWPEQQQIREAHSKAAAKSAPMPVAAPEVFTVATGDEIEVLHIEGKDLNLLLSAHSPLSGPLALVAVGDVTVKNMEPATTDNMVPEFHVTGRPMIWAPVERDDKE